MTYFLVVPKVNGTWKYQLGSNVIVKQVRTKIFRKHCTAVSRHPLKRSKFDLFGNIGIGMPRSIDWVVIG